MRAICGAIITAGALIGLGITALGIGTRYQNFSDRDKVMTDFPAFIPFKALDSTLMVIVLFLIVAAIVGLGLAFFGLALHHERRKREHERWLEEYPATSRGGTAASLPGQRAPMP